MMCALFLRDEKHAQHGRFYTRLERAFDWLLGHYTRGLDVVLRHQRATLITFVLTVAAAVLLYVYVPKGFFPQQDTGIIAGITDAPQDVSFDEMMRLEHRLAEVISADPAVASYGAFVGGGRPLNNGFMILGLKPRDERDASADQVITRLRPKIAQVPGGTVFLQASQDLNVGGRTARTQYQYTLQDANLEELNEFAPRMLGELKKLPTLRDVASDQQSSSTKLQLDIDRDQAARFGIQPALIDNTLYDAFGQRQVTQYFTQLNSYHVVLEVTPALLGDPDSLRKIYIKSPLTNEQVPLSVFTKFDTDHTKLSLHQPPGAVPGGDLVLQPGPRGGAGGCGEADPGDRRDHPHALCDPGHFPGGRRRPSRPPQERALAHPGGDPGGVHHPRRAL